MICPNCRAECRNGDNFCALCGVPLARGKKAASARLVPILILIGLSVLGLVSFFLTM